MEQRDTSDAHLLSLIVSVRSFNAAVPNTVHDKIKFTF